MELIVWPEDFGPWQLSELQTGDDASLRERAQHRGDAEQPELRSDQPLVFNDTVGSSDAKGRENVSALKSDDPAIYAGEGLE